MTESNVLALRSTPIHTYLRFGRAVSWTDIDHTCWKDGDECFLAVSMKLDAALNLKGCSTRKGDLLCFGSKVLG